MPHALPQQQEKKNTHTNAVILCFFDTVVNCYDEGCIDTAFISFDSDAVNVCV